MTPLVLATALVLGVMPVFGVTLNPINLSIGAIVIGLGIDYPIHIIERFDEEVTVSGLVPSEAARQAQCRQLQAWSDEVDATTTCRDCWQAPHDGA